MESPLQNLGDAIKANLVNSLNSKNAVATGRTIRNIEVVTEGVTRMYILGPETLLALEKGRRPTGAAGPVNRIQYGPYSFKQSLYLWMIARNIDKKAFYPIYKKINEKGYEGRPGVVSEPLSDQAINKAMDESLGPLSEIYTQQVLKELFK